MAKMKVATIVTATSVYNEHYQNCYLKQEGLVTFCS